MDQKKVVIFGHGGPVIRAATQALMGAGYRVLIAAPHPFNPFVQDVAPKIGQFASMTCDPCNAEEAARAIKGAFAVLNFTDLPFEAGKETYAHALIDTTICLAKAAKKENVTHFFQMAPLLSQEGTTSAYERTHQQAQEALLTLFPRATILRCGLVYGRQEHFFTPTAAMATLFPLVCVFGSKAGKFQPLYVDDLTRALASLLGSQPGKIRIFELAGPDVYTLQELIDMTLRLCQRRAFVMALPKRFGRVMVWIKGLLGYPLPSLGEVPLLHSDGFVTKHAPGLKELGLAPTPLTSVLPHLLARFRPQF